MTEQPTDRWVRKDVGIGVLFLASGALIAVYAVLAARNGVPIVFWGTGALIGPLLLLLGGSAIHRSLRRAR